MKTTKFEPKKLKAVNQKLKIDLQVINKQLSIFKKIKLFFKK